MLGEKGTQVSSKKVKNLPDNIPDNIRVDVENPAPGQRPGQIQVQRGAGVGKDTLDTLLYDPKTGTLSRAANTTPNRVNKISNTEIRKILKSDAFKQAISKALEILGEK